MTPLQRLQVQVDLEQVLLDLFQEAVSSNAQANPAWALDEKSRAYIQVQAKRHLANLRAQIKEREAFRIASRIRTKSGFGTQV